MSEPFLIPVKFPGNEIDARVRKNQVAEIIRDLWPHRMSGAAAQAIDVYYLGLYADAYQPRHRKDDHV